MPRKTNGSTTVRSKKAAVPVSAVQATPEFQPEVGHNSPRNGKSANLEPVNLEEEIRRRAYELYLQRRATVGAGNGNEPQVACRIHLPDLPTPDYIFGFACTSAGLTCSLP
jgi:hypothetical protein